MNKENYNMILLSVNTTWSCGTVGKFGNAYIDQTAGYLREHGYLVTLKYYRKSVNVESICSEIIKIYDFYGFVVTRTNYKKCLDIAKTVKKFNNKKIIVFYGNFPTNFYREILHETEDLDYIILGDGEEPTRLLLENILSDEAPVPASTGIPYIASKTDLNDKKQYFNQKISHFPALDFYENDTPEQNAKKLYRIQTKNNVCSGNCTFCSERHGKIVYKSIQHIINEIRIVHDKYGVKKFFFNDNNLFDPNDATGKEHVRLLCLELEKLHFKASYQCYCKASSLQDTPQDHELLRLMKKVGFNMIFVGIESGNQEELILYNKLTTLENNAITLKMLKAHKFFPVIGFIGFNPYSTLERIKKNFEYLCSIGCSYLSNYLYSFVDIDKYTVMYDDIQHNGLLKDTQGYSMVEYDYADKTIFPLVDYIKNKIQPRTFEINYETDDVLHSYLDCSIWSSIDNQYLKTLKKMKSEDFKVIKKYLSILLNQADVEAFQAVEEQFWEHFRQNQVHLEFIMKYLDTLYKPLNTNLEPSNIRKQFIKLCESVYQSAGSYDLCPDIIAGKIGSVNQLWFSAPERMKHKEELSDFSFDHHIQTIVIVLESPHIDEFSETSSISDFFDDEITASPALGTTGNKLQKYLIAKLTEANIINSDQNYRIILMNSIQYQCSLGDIPTKYRDHIWLNLWFELNLKTDFHNRLEKYKPDIIINCCTVGGHKSEPDLPKRAKTITRKYLNHCHISQDIKPAKLKEYVQDEIYNYVAYHSHVKLYRSKHPCIWGNKTKINLCV